MKQKGHLYEPGSQITDKFWDFIEKYCPGYHEREEVLRQAQLQLYIDGHESPVAGELSKDEAEDELHHILYNLYRISVEAYAQGEGTECERCNECHTKYCPYCGKMTNNDVIEDPYRCAECGSMEIQETAWVDRNTGEFMDAMPGEENDRWCGCCQAHTLQIRQSELLEDIRQWWGNTGFNEMEQVTGYRQIDFSPEDGYQEFVDACNKHWEGLPVEEKIEKWHTFNNE